MLGCSLFVRFENLHAFESVFFYVYFAAVALRLIKTVTAEDSGEKLIIRLLFSSCYWTKKKMLQMILTTQLFFKTLPYAIAHCVGRLPYAQYKLPLITTRLSTSVNV